jgi:hypothetical protein
MPESTATLTFICKMAFKHVFGRFDGICLFLAFKDTTFFQHQKIY